MVAQPGFQNSALRSELSLVRTKLRDAESQKEKFREGLVAAEKRADRLQSRSLNPSASNVKDESADGPSEEKTSSPQVSVRSSLSDGHSLMCRQYRLANSHRL